MPTSIFEILKWVLATWCLSIATQVISTALIAWKIWQHARLNPVAKSRYMSLIAIIVESGAIYTMSTAFLMALADRKTQAGAIPGDMTAQLAVSTLGVSLLLFSKIASRQLYRPSSSLEWGLAGVKTLLALT
jgi:surface polysaccharide O-acyltransferase-like enzyme